MSVAGILDRSQRDLVTPEGVDLRLVLADVGERAAAFLLDMAIMAGILIAMTLLAIGAGIAANFRSAEFIGSIWLLVWFFLRNFYFMAFELSPRAATPENARKVFVSPRAMAARSRRKRSSRATRCGKSKSSCR